MQKISVTSVIKNIESRKSNINKPLNCLFFNTLPAGFNQFFQSTITNKIRSLQLFIQPKSKENNINRNRNSQYKRNHLKSGEERSKTSITSSETTIFLT